MITTGTKEIISGTEEELLEYFKKKYDLVEKEINDVAKILEHAEKSEPKENKPVQVGNKVTKGIGNLFDGTSWGKN